MLLLQERVPKAQRRVFPHVAEQLAGIRADATTARRRCASSPTPDTPRPRCTCSPTAAITSMVTSAGGGYSRWRDLAVTRWREDATRDYWGTFCYLRDVDSGEFWSTALPADAASGRSTTRRSSPQARAEFRRRDDDIDTHTEIASRPKTTSSCGASRITNRRARARTIELTSYAEVVLAPPAADAAHPAFSNLFVQTEIVRQRTRHPLHAPAALARRAAAVDVPPDGRARRATVGRASYETDRMRVHRPRQHARRTRRRCAGQRRCPAREGSVLDPVVAIRMRITLEPEQTATLDMVSGIAETREAAVGLIEKYHDPRLADRVFELAWTHARWCCARSTRPKRMRARPA